MALNTLPNAGLTNRGYPSDRITTPIIINGDMSVDQRNGTSTINGTSVTYNVDRFLGRGVSSAGVFTLAQDTTAPAGFTNSLKATVTTADSSIASGSSYRVQHLVEGNNSSYLYWGNSGAETVTLSFYVRSSVTGTFGGSFANGDFNRFNVFSYTINQADTWERKVVNITGDTSGTWPTNNTLAIRINWSLGAGSTLLDSAGSWGSSTKEGVTSQTNLIATNSATWYITGVQLEVGEFDSTSIPSFPFESYANNLQKCFRYYELLASGNALTLGFGGTYNSNHPAYAIYYHPKRAVPSLDEVNSSNYYRFYSSGVEYKYNVSSQFFQATITQAMIINGNAGTVADDKVGFFDTINSGAYLALDAEL
jgi:hypothetical protein